MLKMGCKYNQKTALTILIFIKIELLVPLQSLEVSNKEVRGKFF